jgi:hypothetical protein
MAIGFITSRKKSIFSNFICTTCFNPELDPLQVLFTTELSQQQQKAIKKFHKTNSRTTNFLNLSRGPRLHLDKRAALQLQGVRPRRPAAHHRQRVVLERLRSQDGADQRHAAGLALPGIDFTNPHFGRNSFD